MTEYSFEQILEQSLVIPDSVPACVADQLRYMKAVIIQWSRDKASRASVRAGMQADAELLMGPVIDRIIKDVELGFVQDCPVYLMARRVSAIVEDERQKAILASLDPNLPMH
jgi:hypothetical protein